MCVALGLLCFAGSSALGQTTPLRVTINAKAGLQYDVVRFEAKPASKVELKLVNNDDMAPNLVLTKPGQREAVANAALALGTEGDAKNWVPDLDSVLFSTPVLKPDSSHVLSFITPKLPGVYPLSLIHI